MPKTGVWSAEALKRETKRARPLSLAAHLLRAVGNFPALRMEFLKLIARKDANALSEDMYSSARAVRESLPRALRALFWIGEKFVPRKWTDRAIGAVIYGFLGSYFLVKDERAYRRKKAFYGRHDLKIILDVFGEEARTGEEAERYLASYEHIMRKFGGNVSVKLSSLVPSNVWDRALLQEKLRAVFDLSKKYGAPVTIDAEEYFTWCAITEEVFLETICEEPYRGMETVGIALQAYRKDAYDSAFRFVRAAMERGHAFRVRLVKGAYWDEEGRQAAERGVEHPLFELKEATDASFQVIARFFLKHREHIRLALATHNPATFAGVVRDFCREPSDVEAEVLTGMGDSFGIAIARRGISTSVYVPMIRLSGDVHEGMAYLVRRIIENTEGNSCLLD